MQQQCAQVCPPRERGRTPCLGCYVAILHDDLHPDGLRRDQDCEGVSFVGLVLCQYDTHITCRTLPYTYVDAVSDTTDT